MDCRVRLYDGSDLPEATGGGSVGRQRPTTPPSEGLGSLAGAAPAVGTTARSDRAAGSPKRSHLNRRLTGRRRPRCRGWAQSPSCTLCPPESERLNPHFLPHGVPGRQKTLICVAHKSFICYRKNAGHKRCCVLVRKDEKK